MATMIATDCINCGACEPECPNNAISQGDPIFVIDPQLCTECVGFHDYEACAAVCPVDVCITDPNNIETEEALIARARVIHPETNFGDSFESRFRKGQAKAGAADGPAQISAAPVALSVAAANGAAAEFAEADVNYVELPAIDSWNIPLRCYKCDAVQELNVKNFMIGNVIFCPHCHKSTFVRDNLNYQIRTLLKDAYDSWDKEQTLFAERRERERAEFLAKRAAEAEAFETRQKRDLEKIRQALDTIGDQHDAAGKPYKKGSSFTWG
jgi:Fe-S-cluster-containing hydrogenase component 2